MRALYGRLILSPLPTRTYQISDCGALNAHDRLWFFVRVHGTVAQINEIFSSTGAYEWLIHGELKLISDFCQIRGNAKVSADFWQMQLLRYPLKSWIVKPKPNAKVDQIAKWLDARWKIAKVLQSQEHFPVSSALEVLQRQRRWVFCNTKKSTSAAYNLGLTNSLCRFQLNSCSWPPVTI